MTDYVKCSHCKCKSNSDEESIKQVFGYNRLNERFKTCIQCREKERPKSKEYRLKNKEKIAENRRGYYQEHKEQCQRNMKAHRERQKNKEVKGHYKYCSRCYKAQPIKDFEEEHRIVLPDLTFGFETLYFNTCNNCRSRDRIRRSK